jgi:tRNA dimethylallyltransferase
LGLTRAWTDLDDRIHRRIDSMFDCGLVEEVRGLLDRGCTPNHTAMKGLGYRETIDYLQGRESLARTVELIKKNTRRFARRQIGWFRNDPRIRWVDLSEDRQPWPEILKEKP